ncbi:MAG: hypothetical protein LBT11_05660, partial [Treponema sp.]|nr:hypothetical protein [Treponema sp.]
MIFCLYAGCSRSKAASKAASGAVPEAAGSGERTETAYPAADKLFAVIKPGDSPIWFELGAEGPVHIASPEEAVLNPYEPWTRARFVAGMSLARDRLVVAVNRYGFLVWANPRPPRDDAATLYRLPEPAWNNGDLTVAALFRYRSHDAPAARTWDAALLYRDGVFAETEGEPPAERVRALPSDGFEAEAADIPAFAPLPPPELWNLESLRQGRDGAWYFRGRRGGAKPAVAYYRAGELASPGNSITVGVFRNAAIPYTYNEAPPVLREVLDGAAVLAGGKALIAAIVSPEY